MPEDLKKMIVVDYCDTCPHCGTCKPWKSLTAKQRLKLTIGVGVGQFILKGCPLPDKPIEIMSPVKELEDTRPLVLYFGNNEDREEFISIFHEAMPNATAVKL